MVAAATDNDSQVSGSPSTSADSRRILFYSHDGTGLGHLRITLGVATAYSQLRPQDSLLLLTGSLQAGAFDLPANLDYVKLPAMPKRDLYASLPPTEGFSGSHNSTIRFRAALALATVQAFDPQLVVVDHAPGGLFQELAPAIEHLRWSARRPRFALLMRDITFGPEQTRSIWTNEGVYPLLDELYDQILIYGDRRVFDPIQAYAMAESTAARTSFCGYLAPLAPKRSPETVRQELGAGSLPLVVVSVGGGADGGPVLRSYIEGLRDRVGPPLYSYVVAGPLLPEADLAELTALSSCLPNVRFVPFDPDFSAAVQAADVIVSMGGYNSVVEAVYFGKRPVVVPRQPGPEEQVLRAEGFAHLGLATVVKPELLAPEALWAAIEQTLSNGALPAQPLPFDGLTRIAAALAATVSD
jgi:predicted glycosyltransferase